MECWGFATLRPECIIPPHSVRISDSHIWFLALTALGTLVTSDTAKDLGSIEVFATYERVKASGSPGLSLGVLHHGEGLHTAHFGRRDLNKSDSPDDNTIYKVASLIKLVASDAVANLVHEGILDWNLPIQHYLPEFAKR